MYERGGRSKRRGVIFSLNTRAAIVRHDLSAWSVAQREWWVGAALDAKSAADDMVVRLREMQKRERELVATIEILNRKLSTADARSQAARLSAMEGAT